METEIVPSTHKKSPSAVAAFAMEYARGVVCMPILITGAIADFADYALVNRGCSKLGRPFSAVADGANELSDKLNFDFYKDKPRRLGQQFAYATWCTGVIGGVVLGLGMAVAPKLNALQAPKEGDTVIDCPNPPRTWINKQGQTKYIISKDCKPAQ